ncbi:hypothetical protein [Pseudomonas sp. PONIH3]|uniref:hypothetical protein n=1 Tax=Pseudomonas sp. PONIH3 TaxID=1636610 RepID=UPI000CDBCF82|nr:hypothetical protein [Pseudomonas sp. PONIH3]AUY33415.1 hypothetical protein C3F42_09400 [Pseudomonas sp. PONIH3]
MASKYTRIVKDDPTASVTLDCNVLAVVLGMMTREKVRGLTLTKRLAWVAHIQRNGVLHQKEFPYSEKAGAIAWLLCTRAQMQLEGKDTDRRGKWQRSPEVAA